NFYKRLELKQLVIGFRKKDTLFTVDQSSEFNFKELTEESDLKSILKENLAIHFEFSEFNYHKAELWGIGISNGKDHYYVSKETLLQSDALKDYLKNSQFEKYAYDYKAQKVFLMWQGL